MIQGAIPTSLPPLATLRRRTPKRIQIDESLIGLLEGMLSKCNIAYQAQQYLAQLHCHRHHLESLSIASCVEGQKVAHFIKGLA